MKHTQAPSAAEMESANEHMPRKMTYAENAILTVKVLAGFGLLGAALWGASLLTSGR
jgi:hypothetical protein